MHGLKDKLIETLAKSPQLEIGGKGVDFSPVLNRLRDEGELTPQFVEKNFQAYCLEATEEGFFTGYYEPHLEASYEKTDLYTVPIYENPEDLFYIPNLGKFNKHLAGERLAGKFVGKDLEPYPTRGKIYKGAVKAKAKVLAWAKSAVDFFFLQVQGSGVLMFEDGSSQRIGYSGTNGHAYKSIGKHLIGTGKISQENPTMDGVKAYLNSLDPDSLHKALSHNPSYIFFEKRPGEAPIGTHRVGLLEERSLAIDPKYTPLGLPLWLACDHPNGGHIHKLMLAHDTGSAIKGPQRGDYFWGTGEEAGSLAGAMTSPGRYFILLPKV